MPARAQPNKGEALSLALEPVARTARISSVGLIGTNVPLGKESTMVTSRKAFSGSYARLALVGVLVLMGVLIATSIAQATVSISRAELSGAQLRIEGQASPNRTITVDGVAMGTKIGR